MNPPFPLSRYCAEPFTIEPVEVIYERDGKKEITPDLNARTVEADLDYVQSLCGVEISKDKVVGYVKLNIYIIFSEATHIYTET